MCQALFLFIHAGYILIEILLEGSGFPILNRKFLKLWGFSHFSKITWDKEMTLWSPGVAAETLPCPLYQIHMLGWCPNIGVKPLRSDRYVAISANVVCHALL